MNANRKLLIGLAVGWFTLMDVLLRTSGAAVGALGDVGQLVRFGVLPFGVLPIAGSIPSSVLIPILAGAVVGMVMLAFYLISLVLRTWHSVIGLSKDLVNFLLLEDVDPEEVNTFVRKLFGTPSPKSTETNAWRVFGLMASIWGLILFIQLIAGIARSLF